MFLGYRSNDPVITISQNNKTRRIEIRDANHAVEELIGHSPTSMANQPLQKFLPSRITALLEEYVEYEDDGNDVGNVLSKVQSFCMTDHNGKEVAFRLKVIRSESLDGNPYFKLILHNTQGNRRTEAFRSILRENFKGHEVIDPNTNLPDRYSLAKDIELVLFYVHKNELKASFAILNLDDHLDIEKKYGADVPAQMLQHIAAIARQNLRPDDTIGSLPPGRLGLILLDTNVESARMVLNRLRWLIAANPFVLPDKTTHALTVSIAFATIGEWVNDKSILQDAEIFMDRLPASSHNSLQEMSEFAPRQEGNDRRKTTIPYSPERRKADRRHKE